MTRQFISRLFYGSLVMLGVVVIVFFLFQGFGDPSRLVLGQRADAGTLKNIRKELYLDQPKWKQFIFYLNDVSPLSIYKETELSEKNIQGLGIGGKTKLVLKFPYLRRSYQTRRQVWSMLMEALPGTILLAFLAMFLATITGMALGILAAVKKDTWMDTTAIFTSVLGISAPSFFMSIVIAYVFGFVLNRYTGLQMTGSLFDTDPFSGRQCQLRNAILPALTLGIRPMAIIAQLTRGSMLDILNQDYIRTAYAKGFIAETGNLAACLAECIEPGDHCHYRLVCRIAGRRFFCGIYFWLERDRQNNCGCTGQAGLSRGHGICAGNFLFLYQYQYPGRLALPRRGSPG